MRPTTGHYGGEIAPYLAKLYSGAPEEIRTPAPRFAVWALKSRCSSSIRRGPRGDLLSTVFRCVGGSANSRQGAASYRRAAGLSRSPVRAQTRLSRSFPLMPTTSMALCNAAEKTIREATAYW
jgi:hypothetical protein